MASSREYEIVLFGATGYTGLYTAEHITTHLPTNLKWAIAGRSADKLSKIAQDLKKLNNDRASPAIETVQLNATELSAIAKRTKVLINCVGPYSHYGEPVLRACAENGTHYVDVTGEVPWVGEMVKKYHDKAKSTGAIIVPQSGVESTPADLLTFLIAQQISTSTSAHAAEVVFSLHSFKGSPSGGTLATVLTIFDKFSPLDLLKSMSPAFLSPIPLPPSAPRSLATMLTGARTVPGLGQLTTNPIGAADVPIVYRSWALLQDSKEAYGSSFQFSPFKSTRNVFTGTLMHIGALTAPLFLLLPPVRWLLAKYVYQPGQGPTRHEVANDSLEYRAVGWADDRSGKKASGRLRFEGSLYHLTGIFLAHAAATLVYDEDFAAKRMGGGVLTPATLGAPFAGRLEKAGVRFETKMLDY